MFGNMKIKWHAHNKIRNYLIRYNQTIQVIVYFTFFTKQCVYLAQRGVSSSFLIYLHFTKYTVVYKDVLMNL